MDECSGLDRLVSVLSLAGQRANPSFEWLMSPLRGDRGCGCAQVGSYCFFFPDKLWINAFDCGTDSFGLMTLWGSWPHRGVRFPPSGED